MTGINLVDMSSFCDRLEQVAPVFLTMGYILIMVLMECMAFYEYLRYTDW